MKKLYLILAMMCSLLAPRASAEVLNYGYCTDEFTGVGTSTVGSWLAAAIKIPAEQAQQFVGSKITHVNIGFARSTPKRVKLFITKDLAGEPLYYQTPNLSINKFNSVALLQPYEFDGSEIYVGYMIQTTMADDMPIGVDKLITNYNDNSDLISLSTAGEAGLAENWTHVGESKGNVAIRVLIDGENFADWQTRVRPLDILVPPLVRPGYPFDITVALQNQGVQPVNSIKFETQAGTLAPRTVEYTFDNPLQGGACQNIDLSNFTVDEENEDMPFSVKIISVNGDDNQAPDNIVTRFFKSTNYLTQRPMVIEEATGIWCPWCVRGYVALEEMREKYLNDPSYVGIAVHNMSSYSIREEPLHCYSYQPWINRYITGFPKATVNRSITIDPSPDVVKQKYTAVTAMTTSIGLTMEAHYTDASKSSADVTVTMRPFKSFDSHNFGLSFVITEDNVGPYNQSNAYAGGRYGTMGGFENKNDPTPVMYNDVARQIFDWEGSSEGIPSSLSADQTYSFEKTLPLELCKVPDNCHVIALLINKNTGEIENAAKWNLSSPSSILNVAEPQGNVLFRGGYGEAVAEGDAIEMVRVYTMSGVMVASLEGPGSINLAPGLYVMEAEAGGIRRSAKIQVK